VKCAALLALAICLVAVPLAAKDPVGRGVDAGSFGVYNGAKRVATETFSIEETSGGSMIKTDFKAGEGADASHQTSELEITSAGDLRRYEFHELAPGKAQATVVPSESFLMQRSTLNSTEKPEEHPYVLPASTSVLDDFVFVHRQVLAWRYLATACHKGQSGALECPKQKTQMGVVIPRGRASMLVGVTLTGREKVMVHGQERELNRLTLTGDQGEWQLWMDDNFRVVRMFIPDQNTEVVRD
jgi:hypothetical protein